MTREEAASIIEDRVRVTEYVESSYVDCVDIEALKMAIEALKGKDTNVPSRKGVFIPDITVEMFRNASLEGVEELMASGEMEDISLPSVQPERKNGEWEEIEVIADAYDISGVKTWASKMKCDQCGFTTIAIEGRFSQYNFCPNCGADMRGEQNDEQRSNQLFKSSKKNSIR